MEYSELLSGDDVNYLDGLNRFMNNEELYVKFLKKFPDDPSFSQLEEYLENSQQEDAFRAAHTLKGIAGNLSLVSLFHASNEQLEALRNGDLKRGQELMVKTRTAYDRVIELLNNII